MIGGRTIITPGCRGKLVPRETERRDVLFSSITVKFT